ARAAFRRLLHVVVGREREDGSDANREGEHDEHSHASHMYWSLIACSYCSFRISAVAVMVNALPTFESLTMSLATGCSTVNEYGWAQVPRGPDVVCPPPIDTSRGVTVAVASAG